MDEHRSADGHQAGELENLGVTQSYTAVRDVAGDQVRLVGAVDADVAPRRPIGQPVADVELPARSGIGGTPNPDRSAEDCAVAAKQGQRQGSAIDDDAGVDE